MTLFELKYTRNSRGKSVDFIHRFKDKTKFNRKKLQVLLSPICSEIKTNKVLIY